MFNFRPGWLSQQQYVLLRRKRDERIRVGCDMKNSASGMFSWRRPPDVHMRGSLGSCVHEPGAQKKLD